MLKFGTGGTPWTAKKKDTISGITRNDELGLDHLELEFVQGVRMKEEKAIEVREHLQKINSQRKENNRPDFDLTIHGPYYVNMASIDERIIANTENHILSSLRIGNVMGAKSVTYHAGSFMKFTKEEVYERIENMTKKIVDIMHDEKLNIIMSPELTGKEAQFGSLPDLVRLCKAVKGVKICYDFAHNYARSVGKNNTKAEIQDSLKFIQDELGGDFLKNIQIHMSNIIYSDKGERWHLPFLEKVEDYEKILTHGFEFEKLKSELDEFYENGKKVYENKFDWRMILETLKEFEVGGWVVCESPILEWDGKLMQEYYRSL